MVTVLRGGRQGVGGDSRSKLTAAVLALCLALSVASCTSQGNPDPSVATAPAASSTESVPDASPESPVDASTAASSNDTSTPTGDSQASASASSAASGSSDAVELQPSAIDHEAWSECVLETFPSQVPLSGGEVHVAELPGGFVYNSVPASQGPHDGENWTIFGEHHEPQDELLTVHSLEHGGISVSYGPEVDAHAVAQIEQWWMSDPDGIIILPDPRLGSTIAAAAWITTSDPSVPIDELYRTSQGKVLTCPALDLESIERFRTTFLGQSLERIPIELMAPGN